MNTELITALDILEKEKKISKKVLIERMKTLQPKLIRKQETLR